MPPTPVFPGKIANGSLNLAAINAMTCLEFGCKIFNYLIFLLLLLLTGIELVRFKQNTDSFHERLNIWYKIMSVISQNCFTVWCLLRRLSPWSDIGIIVKYQTISNDFELCIMNKLSIS